MSYIAFATNFASEGIARVEDAVLEELIQTAVELVAAGLGGDGDIRGLAKLRVIVRRIDLEFADGLHGRKQVRARAIEAGVHGADSIDRVAGGVWKTASNRDVAVRIGLHARSKRCHIQRRRIVRRAKVQRQRIDVGTRKRMRHRSVIGEQRGTVHLDGGRY